MNLKNSSPQRKRFIICVDGTWCSEDGKGTGSKNQTNIFRIYASIAKGPCYDDETGLWYEQKAVYVNGLGADKGLELSQKWISGAFGKGVSKKIQEVYQRCCELDPEDEVWLYGFSRGAFVVRAVAGLLHYIRALESRGDSFQADYDKAIEIYGQIRRIYNFVQEKTRPAPTVKFVGAFDTVKALSDEHLHDIKLNTSICHMRHVLALHEDRMRFEPECVYPDLRSLSEPSGARTFIQAWFVGTHSDMGGSQHHDGLSLYPLQWMLSESQRHGLKLEFTQLTDLDNPLEVVCMNDPSIQGHTFGTQNTLEVTMYDLRSVHNKSSYKGRYEIKLNKCVPKFWPRRKRVLFNEERLLMGYNEKMPNGSIIHPSVYFLMNHHVPSLVAMDKHGKDLKTSLDRVEHNMLGRVGDFTSGRITVDHGFWATDNPEDDGSDRKFPIRLLVCGNAGVGKSSLINKVFGVPIAEPSDRVSGNHEILQEYTWKDRPDLIIHDSRGFEAASEEEMNIVGEFLRDRSNNEKPEERLHMIWFCMETSSDRPQQQSTRVLFETISQCANNVPIIVVATKSDRYESEKRIQRQAELQEEGHPFNEELNQKSKEYADQKLLERVELIETEMRQLLGSDTLCQLELCVSISNKNTESINRLTRETIRCIGNGDIRTAYIAAQINDIGAKIDIALQNVLKQYQKILLASTVSGFVPIAPTVGQGIGALAACKTITSAFGLRTIEPTTALGILKKNVWQDRGLHAMIGLAEGLSLLGHGATILTLGIPVSLVTGSVNTALVIPAAVRLYLIMSCDLILILVRCLVESCNANVGLPQPKHLQDQASEYSRSGVAREVQKRVQKLVPKRYLFNSFRRDKISEGIEQIVKEYSQEILQQSKYTPTGRSVDAMTSARDKAIGNSESQVHEEEEDILGDIKEEVMKESMKNTPPQSTKQAPAIPKAFSNEIATGL